MRKLHKCPVCKSEFHYSDTGIKIIKDKMEDMISEIILYMVDNYDDKGAIDVEIISQKYLKLN